VDGTIAIWDIRTGKKPCISIKAHKADVNVISWNRYIQRKTLEFTSTTTSASQYFTHILTCIIRLASSMIASGCDDGSFSVRDLRSIQVFLLDISQFLCL
jgi:ribosome assembly protein RRB1